MFWPILGWFGGLQIEIEVEDAIVCDLEEVGAAIVIDVENPALE